MTTLSQAPLIEVATELRWGTPERDDAGEFVGYKFSDEEIDSLPDELGRALADVGLTDAEAFARELEDVQFAVARRYRPAPGEFPIIQTGLGVFSLHERNDRYKWETYRQTVLEVFQRISQALSAFYGGSPPFIGAELRYVDAYFLEEGETPASFLANKLKLRLVPSKEFREAPFIDPEVLGASLDFQMRLNEPVGVIDLMLTHADIAGRPAYIMDTRVRSVGSDVTYTLDGLHDWLESAHKVQQHAFQTLIHPAYLKSFE